MKRLLLVSIALCLYTFNTLAQDKSLENRVKGDPDKKIEYKESLVKSRPDVAFTQRLGTGGMNVRGNMTFIANNIMNREYTTIYRRSSSPQWQLDNCGDWYWDYVYTAAGSLDANDSHPSSPTRYYRRSTDACNRHYYSNINTLNNGQANMQYIDIDNADGIPGSGSTFSSSRSTLALPNCSRVVFAGLYWAGVYPYEDFATQTARDAAALRSIKFKIPGNANYVDLTASTVTADKEVYDNNSDGAYVCFKDVTAMVAGQATANGNYYVANVKGARGIDNLRGIGGSAGWTLVIIYENQNESSKNISIFDGFVTVTPSSGSNVDINYSGFTTIPAGPVRAEIMAATLEGDGYIPGDRFQIRNKVGTYEDISNAVNPANNFFNGSITRNNNHTTTRNPQSTNTLGFDMDHVVLNNPSNSIIGNGDTSANIRFTTGGDVYWPFLNALSVEIIEPELQLIKTIDDGAGNDLSGQTVALGSELWYNISFQNVGTDNALNAEIVDLLPKNVDLVPGELQLPAGIPASNVTYVAPSLANGFRGRLTIQIPDSMVQENGAKYNIRFKVKVAATCNDLRDVCSNVVQNQAFANYDSDRGGLPRKINEPSFAGLDACNFGIVGTSNFLADTSGCTFTRDEVLCGSSITLTAGAGFASYEWRNGAGTVIGNTQSITVNATGTYTVNKVAPVGCINATETINVIPYTTQPNPLIPFADRMLTCPSDGSDLAEMYLCGVGGSRSINLPITPGSGTTVRWFKLDETSCPDETTAGCANKNTSCTWNEVSTALTYNVTDAGEYKVEVLYDGRCPSEYFFNVFKATLNPDIVKTDITCGNNGQIIINNVPAGYQYSLSGPGGYFVDFQNSNTFTVTNPGDYNLRIRINNPTAASCVYDFGPINIRDLSIALDVTTTNILCAGDRGRIRVRVNNVPGQYTYTLLQGATTVATQGPINSNDYTFEVSTGGNYTVRVATPSCNTTQDVVITQAPALTLTAAATKNISCTAGSSAGIINLTAAGGTLTTGAQYTFAVWTDKGTDLYTNVADIPSSAYFTNTTYNVTNGNQGTYRFVVVDSNNCATISNPVTITVEPPLAFNHTANDVSCVGNSDGSIAVSVNGSNQGYTVEYSIDGGTSWNTTGNFTGLAPGSYDINIRATKTSYQCLYTIDKILINNKTAITGSASLTQNYTCTQQGEITFAAASGGTAPYSYGIDGVYSTNRVKGGLTQGTYALTIRDANNCVLTLSNITIDPLPTAPTLAATIAYSCTGAGNVTITPLSAGYTYSLDGATPVTTNVFTNVSVGNHTVTVNYGRNCTRNVSFNVAANQAFTGTVVGSTNSVCHSADNGTITISASNFVGGDYEYSIDGGANWLTAVDNPSRIVGVPDGTHNIRIRETFGGATCVVDLGNVTITEPPQLNLTATVTSNPSCTGTTTGATVTAVATGGTPPYTYSIDGGLTWQSSGVFTNVAPSATDYIINVRDSRNCDECGCTVDPFVNGGFELPTTTGRRYRSLHEDQVPGWDTTASDNRIEIWSNGFNGVTASEGVSFAELNANAVSTLYQEYCTQPGDIISWSLDHRGRAGTDVANVKIGGDLGSATVQRTMTDGNTRWGSYSGTYTVPAGQSTTVIAFEAVSTATGSLTVGNFIDNVNIRITKVTCTPVRVTVNPPAPVTHTATVTNCYDGTNGQIAVNVTQGVQNYLFRINGGAWVAPTPATATSHTFTGLTPGAYTIEVQDALGCVSAASNHRLDDTLTATTAVTNITCNPGSITINATGGDGNYRYAAVPTGGTPTFGTSNTIAATAPGVYDIYVRDNSGNAGYCEFRDNVTVRAIANPVATLTPSQPNCNGDTGSISVAITQGVGPYTVRMTATTAGTTTTVGPSASTTAVFNTLGADTYTFVVTDANGCTSAAVSETITVPTTITGSASLTENYTCTQQGEITFAIAGGGTAPYSYGIDGVYSTNRVKTGLTEGTYVLTIRDANNCVRTLPSITIDRLPTLPAFTPAVAYNCTGSGNITITPTGAGYTYSLDGAPAVTTNVFNNVAVGPHTVTINYGRSCTTNVAVTVLANQQFAASITGSTNSTCNGADNGTITIAASNFGASFDYTVNGGTNWINATSSPVTVNNVPDGVNNVRVRISAGVCELDLGNVTITEPAAVGVTATITSPANCTATPGATITAVATGGTAPYEYSINGGTTWQSSGVFTNVTASGTAYTIQARDSRNCASTSNATITVNPPSTVTHTATVTNCYDGTNGQIVVTAANGVQNYLFRINGGAWVNASPATSTSHTFTGLTPGAYTIQVQDALGCVSTVSNHRLDDTLTATTAITSVTCNPGSVVITAAGGDGNYRYAAVAVGGTPTFGTSNTIAIPAGGPYDIYVRDNSGNAGYCEFTNRITVPAVANPVAALTTTQPNCNGDTGSISVAITQGVGPYTVRMTAVTAGTTTTVGPSASTTAVFNTLGADTYNFVVTDANGCTSTQVSATITVPTTIAGTASLTQNYTCTQQGQITFAGVSGGTAPYSYGINGVYSTAAVKTGLTEGTYILTIRDANNCVRTLPNITIDPLPALPSFATAVAYNCDGTGNVTVTPTGAGYTYSLDGAAAVTTNVFNNVAVGPHTITINYGRSCTTNVSVTVLANQQFTASVTGSTNSTCNGADNGTITIAASNFGASFDYTVNGGTNWINATSSPVTVNNVPDGVNNVRVRISAGVCERDLGNVTITEPAAVGVTATITSPANCTATPGATITAVATGGTAPYEYSINGGTTWQSSGVFTNVAASGTAYTIQARDSRNCASTTNATITVNPPSTVTHTATVTNCYDGTNGQIVVTAANGVQNYLFRINGGAWVNASPATSTSHTFTGLTPGAYTIQVQDALGCVSTVSNHRLDDTLTATTAITSVTCNPGSVVITAAGGDGNYRYAAVAAGGTPTFGTSNTIAIPAGGPYDIYVRDNSGNAGYCEFTNRITVPAVANPVAALTTTQPNCNGDTGSISVAITQGVGPYTVRMTAVTAGTTTNVGPSASTTAVFNTLGADTYNFVVTDANGCTSTQVSATITVPTTIAGTASLTQNYTCTQQGQITFAGVSGGTAPYSYGINGVYSTAAVKTGLTEGTYVLTIRDANNCVRTLPNITIDPLPALPSFATAVAYNCDGTGNVTVTPTGAGYTYSLDGAAAVTTNVFNNVAVGPHTITINYGRSCTTNVSVTVLANQQFTASVTGSTNSTCNGADNGTITIAASNFGASFDYTVNGGTNWINATSSPVTVNNVPDGVNNVRVRISAGVCERDLGNVTITEPAAVGVTATITSPTNCTATPGATITAVATGGTAPYEYSINGGTTWQSSGVFTNVAASGTAYTIQARDSRNCASTTNATITVNPPSTVTHTATVTNCYNGANGQIVVTAASGVQNYLFRINGGAWQTPSPATATSYTFTGLAAGNHTVQVQDALGCVSTASTETINGQLTLGTTVVDVNCNAGTITATAGGGTGAGTYVFAFVNQGATPAPGDFGAANTFNIAVGTTTPARYDVYVRDNSGNAGYCQESVLNVTVNTTATVGLSHTATQPTCNGDRGSFVLNITGGLQPHAIAVTGPGGYTNNVTNFVNASNTYTNLVAGAYNVTITDANGCTDTETVNIVNPAPLVIDIDDVLPPNCAVDPANTGFNFINISPASFAPYTLQYSVDNGTTWVDFTTTNGQVRGYNSGDVIFPALRVFDTATNTTRCLVNYGRYEIAYNVEGLIVNPVANPADCSSGFSVTVEAVNGTGPFEFAKDTPTGWQPHDTTSPTTVQPDQTRTRTYPNLTPGRTYDFYVRDASGCIRQNNEDIYNTFTPSVPISVTVNNNQCAGSTNGQMTFTINNASGDLVLPFDWTIYRKDSPTVSTPVENSAAAGETSLTITSSVGLAAGEYYIEISNRVGGCKFGSADTEIKAGNAITGTVVKANDITCNTPGVVNIQNVVGGFGSYSYALTVTNATGITTPTTATTVSIPYANVTNPANPVTVEVVVTDASGCSQNLGTVSLNVSPLPSLDSAVTSTCGTNKTITVTASGGTAPYSYSIDGGTTYQSNALFENLAPNNYTVQVKDANGCESSTLVRTIHPSLDYTVALTKTLDCTSAAGYSINVASGTGNYSYVVETVPAGTNVIPATVFAGASANFTIATAGDYRVVMTDTGSNCSLTRNFTVAPSVTPSFTHVATNSVCQGSNSGSIRLTAVDNGILPLTFAITPAAGTYNAATSTYENLPPNTYSIQATGANGCTTTVNNIVISEFAAIAVPAAVVTQFGCTTGNTTNNATITVPNTGATVVTGGSGTYVRVEFINTQGTATTADDVVVQNGASFTYTSTDEAGGSYQINVYDDSGCSGSTTATIAPFGKLLTAPVAVNKAIDCATGENITVSFTSSNPIPAANISYTVTGAGTGFTATNATGVFTNLATDTYTITVRNTGTGCVLTTTHEVKAAPSFVVDINRLSNVTCFGSTTGSISFGFSASTPYTGNYNYEVFQSSGTTTGITGNNVTGVTTVSNLAAGTYYARLTMVATPFCPVQSSNITIEAPAAALTFTSTIGEIDCTGGNNGSITVNATGGWGSYQYQLESTTGTIITAYSGTNVFNGLSANTYVVRVRDANGCIVTNNAVVNNPTPVTFTLAKDDNACTSTSGGSITVTAAGGSPAYTYILSQGATVVATQPSNVFTNLGAGLYTVQVRDSKGCTAAATQNITLLPELEFTVTETKKIDCTAAPDATIQVAMSSGSGNYEYEVLNSGGATVVTRVAITGTTVSFNVATADTYTVRVFDVGVTPNCSETKTVVIAPRIEPNFTHVATNSICQGSNSGSIRLTAVDNGIVPLTYAITPAAGTFNAATNTFENLPPNTYSITATGTNSCTTTVNNIVITEFAAIAVPAAVVTEFGCTTGNTTNNATITVPNTGATVVTGGSGTYVRVEFINTQGTATTADDVVVQNGASFTYTSTDEAGGSYRINVYDDSGCSGSTTATIAPFGKLLTAPVVVNKAIDCATGENITVSFTSSTPVPAANISYTVTGVGTGFTATNATGVFTNLATDNYTITVRNAGTGCVLTTAHEVKAAPSFVVDINRLSNVTCLGSTTGSISFGFSASTPYTGNYNYEVFQSSGTTTGITGNNVTGVTTVSNLAAGTYYARLTMVASPFCPVQSSNITIEAPAAALTFTSTIGEIDCTGGNNGSITVNATGGWGSYQYQLESTTGTVITAYTGVNVFNGLSANTYVVRVRDANGCIVTNNAVVNNPTPVTFTMVKDDNACTSTSGGSITVTAAGGSPAYTYILSRGGTVVATQPSNVFTNLGAGNYAVEVRDSKGCTAAAQNIVLLPELEFTVTETKKIDCTAAPDATIQVAMSSGSGNYEYEVLNSGGATVVTRVAITGTTVSFNVATADTYTVRVFDVGVTPNCSETKTVVIAPRIEPNFTHVATNSICQGSNSGSIRLTAVDNGIVPLTYAITPAAGTFNAATNTFENLPPNTYSITATGTNSCTTTVNNIVITEFAAIAVPAAVVTEFGCTTGNTTNNATITVPNTGATVVTGGSGTYVRVEFINTQGTATTADDVVVQNGASFTYTSTDEAGGSYRINVYDDSGCSGSTTATIAPFGKLLTAPVVVNKAIDCATGENITVSFTSSTPVPAANISYTVTGVGTGFTATNATGVFTNLATDNYTITVRNAGTGCVLTTAHEVKAAPSFVVDINRLSNVTCLGSTTGSISFGFSASTPYTGNYNYEVFQSSGTTTGITGNNVTGVTTVSNLAAGTYYARLTMVASPFCPVQSSNITIEAPAAALTFTSTIGEIDCTGGNNGSITVNATGGWGSYQYQLESTGGTVLTAYTATNIFNGLSANTYVVRVRDANGCIVTNNAVVNNPTPVTFTMVKDDNACTATSGGSITVTAAGGSPAYTYILSRGGTVIRSQASNVFTNLGAGNYAVEVRDSKGCTAAAQNIVLLPELEFTVTETKKIDCTASPAATVQVAVSSGSGNYEYEVLNSAGVNVVTRVAIAGTTVTFSAATADTYTVRVFDVGVTPNCSETKTINIAPSINPSFTHVVTNSVCNGSNSGSIRVTAVANGAEPLTYAITPAAGTFNTATSSFENLPPNTYSITATGANSCTTTVNNIVITEFAAIAVPTPVVNQFGCTTANTTNPATITIPNTGATVITGGSGTYVRVEFIDTKGTPDTADDFVVQDSNNFTYSTTDEAGSTYQINVYDDRGCVGSTTATIAPFAKLLTAPVAVDKAIDCATGENITVTFTSSNPIPAANISYTITGANTGFTATNSTGVFTNLATDIYNIAVTNTGTGCVLTTSHSVSTPPSHTVDINKVSNVACLGTATGAISFGFSAAPAYTGNYNYEVFQSSGTTTGITGNNVNGTTTVSTLPAGTYYVQLTMVASPFCPVRSGNITIEAPSAALTLTANPSLISCVRPDSGEVQLTAAGGWGSYQYQLVNTTTSTTVQAYANKNVIDGLVAGRYEATVRDLNGCTTTVSFELTDPTAITATFTVANNACYADAAASITVTNPTGGQGTPAVYRYSLTYPNGTISAIQTGNVFTNLKAGNYEIRVYDDYSCQSAPIPVTITDPTRVVAQATIVAPITCTRSQSSVQVSGTGGTGAYMYSMDGTNFVASNVFNVDAGKHQFYVRDANGCISDPVSLVTVDPYEEIRSRLVVNAGVITCNGENNGVLSATVVGGLGNYRYELLDDANNVVRPLQTTSRFDQLSAGRYKIRVYSSNAGGDICQIDTSVHEITEPDALRIASDVKQVSCNGGNDGRITINSRGGNGGYQYNISPGFAPSKFVSNNVFDNLAPGTYTITVKDQVGCYDTITVQIAQPSAVTAALVNVTQQVCSADPTPTISITIGGGILPAGGPTTYIISLNGIDLPGTYNAGTVVLGAAEGIEANKKYGIGVRSVSGGCSPVFIPTVIETVKPIALQLQAGLTYTCPTGNVINAGVQDEYKSVVVYSLLDNGSIVASNDTGIFTNVAPSANYTVSVEHVVSSCPVSVTIPEVRDVTALAMAVDDSQKNKLIASGNFGLPPYEYSFDDGDFSSDNEMTILETRDYRIRVRDSRGCIVEMIVEGVYITIEVPNLFTPDGDGQDDYWYPTQVEDYHEVRVFIYDRYARQIKVFTGSQQGWDGKYEGRDLPSGDYWYTIYFKELSGQERKIMGHFTLYR